MSTVCISLLVQLKHTTTLFFLSDHDILSREWRVVVDQERNNQHGRPNCTIISRVWPIFWLWGILIMVGCVLSQLKPSEFSILSCEKGLGLRPRSFFTAKNGELLELYLIHKDHPFQGGESLYTSESDVCRRQILTYEDGARTEIIKIFPLVVDP